MHKKFKKLQKSAELKIQLKMKIAQKWQKNWKRFRNRQIWKSHQNWQIANEGKNSAEKIRESKTNTHCVNIWQFDEQFCVINKSLLIRFAYYDTKLHY